MQEVKTATTSKTADESKDQRESKKKTTTNAKAWNWQPIATDLAVTVARGIVSGFALKLGSEIYSQSFNRRMHSSPLTVLNGGKTSVAI